MKTIETRITIKAPIQKVWDTLFQFEAYPEWNPFITQISGNPTPGNSLKTAIQIPGKTPMIFTPKVLVSQTHKEFRWKGKLGITGIFDGEHYFQLSITNSNETVFTHGEKFTGILSGLMLRFIKEDTLKGFTAMNMAMKNQCEK